MAGFLSLKNTVDDFGRFKVTNGQGSATVSFEKPGTYTIYYESHSKVCQDLTQSGSGCTTETVRGPKSPPAGLSITISKDGQDLDVKKAKNSFDYTLGDYTGKAVGSVKVDEPGAYSMVVQTRREGDFAIALGKDVVSTIVPWLIGAAGAGRAGRDPRPARPDPDRRQAGAAQARSGHGGGHAVPVGATVRRDTRPGRRARRAPRRRARRCAGTDRSQPLHPARRWLVHAAAGRPRPARSGRGPGAPAARSGRSAAGTGPPRRAGRRRCWAGTPAADRTVAGAAARRRAVTGALAPPPPAPGSPAPPPPPAAAPGGSGTAAPAPPPPPGAPDEAPQTPTEGGALPPPPPPPPGT